MMTVLLLSLYVLCISHGRWGPLIVAVGTLAFGVVVINLHAEGGTGKHRVVRSVLGDDQAVDRRDGEN
jgi:hypothetical protein